MTEKEDIKKELIGISVDFPMLKSKEAPEGYFEKLPDQVLNRWREEKSKVRIKPLWRKTAQIAAMICVILGGAWMIFFRGDTTLKPISSQEALLYIEENISDFESLLETTEVPLNEFDTGITPQDIEEYLIEELEDNNAEDLF